VLLDYLKKIKAGLFVQIRTFKRFPEEQLILYKKSGFLYSDHLNAFIDLRGFDSQNIFSSFKKDKRKGIRRAIQRYNLDIKEYNSVEKSIAIFYNMQKELYKKKRHAMKSRDFFTNLVAESQGHVRIAFATFEGKPIASQLYICYNNKITALYTATLESHYDKHGGDYLIWYLLKKGIDEGYEVFDFGGGGNPNKFYGPRAYKERFGTSFQNVGRLNLPKSYLYNIIMFVYNKVLKN
ncbi:MAG: GNAT family N-acetyltransferase, partial [Bacteroidota bacterium]